MTETYLFLSIIFLATFLIGNLLEKIRIPWIFGSLIFGTILASTHLFSNVTTSPTFVFLSSLGTYFLLFIIGAEINLSEMRKKEVFIIKSTFLVILIEALFGGLAVNFIFHLSPVVSFLVALSFATVGEAILLPILDEFGITEKPLGQLITGIGTLGNAIEIVLLVLVSILIGNTGFVVLLSLLLLFALTATFRLLKNSGKKFVHFKLETIFLVSCSILFLFLAVGSLSDAAPLAALLAGIGLRTFLPTERLKLIESEIRAIAYGFFAPIFFVSVGSSLDINYILKNYLLVFIFVIVTNGAKLLASILVGYKELGIDQSLLLGIGLSVRFNTGIIILKVLLEKGQIGQDVYSVIIASSIVFIILVPALFARLTARQAKSHNDSSPIGVMTSE